MPQPAVVAIQAATHVIIILILVTVILVAEHINDSMKAVYLTITEYWIEALRHRSHPNLEAMLCPIALRPCALCHQPKTNKQQESHKLMLFYRGLAVQFTLHHTPFMQAMDERYPQHSPAILHAAGKVNAGRLFEIFRRTCNLGYIVAIHEYL